MHPLVVAGLGLRLTRLQVVPGVRENPRIVERAPADAHPGAAGLVKHVLGRFGCRDVAIANDGDFFHGRHHGADAGEIDGAAEPLGARAAMHKNGGDSGVLQHAGEVGRREIVFVPAEPHLGGDGDLHGGHHAAHKRRGLVQLGHHRGAAADAGDLLHGAAHVDVHRGDAERLDHLGRVAHLLGHRAEELHGEQLLGRAGADHLQGPRVLLNQGAGVDEIGRGPVESADFAHDEPERQVGVARQRREKEIRIKLVGPDAHGVAQRAPRARFMRARASASVARGQPKFSRTCEPRGPPKNAPSLKPIP